MAFRRRFKRRRRFYKRRFSRRSFKRYGRKRYSTIGSKPFNARVYIPWSVQHDLNRINPKNIGRALLPKPNGQWGYTKINPKTLQTKAMSTWVNKNIIPVLLETNKSGIVKNRWAVMAYLSAMAFVQTAATIGALAYKNPRVYKLAQTVRSLIKISGLSTTLSRKFGGVSKIVRDFFKTPTRDIIDLERGEGGIGDLNFLQSPQLETGLDPSLRLVAELERFGVNPRFHGIDQERLEFDLAGLQGGHYKLQDLPRENREQLAFTLGLRAPLKTKTLARIDPSIDRAFTHTFQDMLHREGMQQAADKTVGEGVAKFSTSEL